MIIYIPETKSFLEIGNINAKMSRDIERLFLDAHAVLSSGGFPAGRLDWNENTKTYECSLDTFLKTRAKLNSDIRAQNAYSGAKNALL